MILAAAAGELSAPEMLPVRVEYPSLAMRNGQSAAALIDVVVDPDGLPVICKSLEMFGNKKFAGDICELQGVFRYRPAVSIDGQPTYGIVRVLMKYALLGSRQGNSIKKLSAPGMEFEVIGAKMRAGSRYPDIEKFDNVSGELELVSRPDVTLDVLALPGIESNYLDQRVIVAVDASGKVIECADDETGENENSHTAYAKAACQQLANLTIAEPLMVGETSVAYVRALQVRFAVSSNNRSE